MVDLSLAQRRSFRRNGFLVVHGAVDDDVVERAREATWAAADADPDDPVSLLDGGHGGVGETPDPGAFEAVTEQAFPYAEALVGEGGLTDPSPAAPLLNFPDGTLEYERPTPHLDGYPAPSNDVPEGTVAAFTVATTVYLDRVDPRGGGFTVWPGSHEAMADHFRTRALDSLDGGAVPESVALDDPFEVTGGAGTLVVWHDKLAHAAGPNTSARARLATFNRHSTPDIEETKWDASDIWAGWAVADVDPSPL